RTHNRSTLIVDIDRFDKRAIDLDLVEREGAKVRKGRIASTKIVHGYADAQHLDSPERRQCAIQVANERRFGDLKLQAARSQTSLKQNLVYRMGKVCIVNLHR